MKRKDNDQLSRLRQKNRFEEPSKGYNLITLIAVFLVAVSLTGTVWYIYDSSQDKPEGEVIVISADNEEIKVKPSDPGGMVVDNMDKAIYDTIDRSSKDSDAKLEKLLPLAEEPIDKSVVLLESQESSSNEVQDSVLVVEEAENEVPVTEAVQPATEASAPVKTVKDDYIQPTVKQESSKKTVNFVKKDEKFYKVQLASFKSSSDVEKEWSNLSRRFPKLVGSYTHYIATKNVEGKGIFYRLQIGPFDKEADANRACKLLKESNVNCLVIKP